MKKNLLFLLSLSAFVLFSCGSKDKKTGGTENKTYPVSMTGFDSLKLDMNKAELEKLLNAKITLKHIGVDYSPDTVQVKYKGMDMLLYLDAGDSSSVAILRGIRTSDSSFKTNAGMGVGSDKINIIDAYPDFTRYVAPEYEEYPVRSTTRSAVAVMDTAGYSVALIFRIVNKKCVSLELNNYYEFY